MRLPPRDPNRLPIYNVDALHEKLEDISWPTGLDFREGMLIDSQGETVVNNIDDDLERELVFYTQVGFVLCEQIGALFGLLLVPGRALLGCCCSTR